MLQETLYGWYLNAGVTDYRLALEWQHGLVSMRKEGLARDTIIFLEHPPVVTVGKDGHEENYRDLETAPVPVERGGDVTWHGPGQLVVYFIFNLTRRGRDLHLFMDNIQLGIIQALKEFGIHARQDSDNTGVWVDDRKIASIGVAVKNWISFHGAAINLNADTNQFSQIHPCGLEADVMTSACDIIDSKIDMDAFRKVLLARYSELFATVFTPIELETLAEEIESQKGGDVI